MWLLAVCLVGTQTCAFIDNRDNSWHHQSRAGGIRTPFGLRTPWSRQIAAKLFLSRCSTSVVTAPDPDNVLLQPLFVVGLALPFSNSAYLRAALSKD